MSIICISGVTAGTVSVSTQPVNTTIVQGNVSTQLNTTTSTNDQSSAINTSTNIKVAQNTSQTTNQTTNPLPDSIQHPEAAAGTTKTVVNTNFTMTQIKTAATSVESYIKTNHKLPNYVTIGTTEVSMPDFLRLLTTDILQTYSKTTTSITLKTLTTSAKPTENVTTGTISKANYLNLASRVNTFMNKYSVLPNYANSTLGKINYESLIYTFSKILAFDSTNSRLPNSVSVVPWSSIATTTATTVSSANTTTPIPASLDEYLLATTNCQVNNAQIQALAKSLATTSNTPLGKATAIFNWVRDNIGYSFYYNSEEGAVGALEAKTANCCDTSNLLVALERAAGIPARYEHVYAQFSSGTWYGHVIAQVWVNGVWYNTDAISYNNTFGVINNWNTKTAIIYGTYATLPF